MLDQEMNNFQKNKNFVNEDDGLEERDESDLNESELLNEKDPIL